MKIYFFFIVKYSKKINKKKHLIFNKRDNYHLFSQFNKLNNSKIRKSRIIKSPNNYERNCTW